MSQKILFLVPEIAMDRIQKCYLEKLHNIKEEDIIIKKLYLTDKKTSASIRKQFINEEVIPLVTTRGIQHILVTDGDYFKTFTKQTKVDVFLGYEMPCMICPIKDVKIMYVPNFFRIFYNPDIEEKINFALSKLDAVYSGSYKEPGKDIIHSAWYPDKEKDISDYLQRLYQCPFLKEFPFHLILFLFFRCYLLYLHYFL